MKNRICQALLLASLVAVFGSVGPLAAQTPFSLEAIVKAGDPAPGTGGGTFAEIPRSTYINAVARSANGRLAFVASISGGDVDSGLFVRELDGSLRAVVVADSAGINGTPLPGVPGSYGVGEPCAGCAGRAEWLGRPGIDDKGRVAFIARLVGGNVDKGLYVADPDGSFKIVALASYNLDDRTTSTPVPGTPGWTIQDFHFERLYRSIDSDAEAPAMNGAGEIAFYAVLDNPTEFLFAETILAAHFEEGAAVATLRKVVVTGDSAPEPGDSPIASLTNLPYVSLNSFGDVAFDEFPDFPEAVTRRLFMADAAASLIKLAQNGDSVSFPENATIANFRLTPQINDSCANASPYGARVCEAAFFATLEHAQMTSGIFLRRLDGSSAALVLADNAGSDGTPVPGTLHTFTQLSDPANLTNTRRFTFQGTYESRCSQGIFAWLGNEVVTIAKEGDSVPGLTPPLFRFSVPYLDPTGDVVFTATLADKSVGDCFVDGSLAAATPKELSWSAVNTPQVQPRAVDLAADDQIFSALPNLSFLGTFLESFITTPTVETAPAGSEFTWTLRTDSGATIQLKLVSEGVQPPVSIRVQYKLQLLVDGVLLASTTRRLSPAAIANEYFNVFALALQERGGVPHLVGGILPPTGEREPVFDVTGPAVDALREDELVEIRFGVTGNEATQYSLEQVVITTEPVSPAVFLASPSSQVRIELLIDWVKSLNLQQGISNSLDAKLQNALDALNAANAGQRQDASNKLMAFINAVEAQRDKEITSAQADELIALAIRILAVL